MTAAIVPSGFLITAASEIMAILALAANRGVCVRAWRALSSAQNRSGAAGAGSQTCKRPGL